MNPWIPVNRRVRSWLKNARNQTFRKKNASGFMSRTTSGRLVGVESRATLLGCILGIYLMASTQAHSALVVTVTEVGSDVVFSWGDGVSTLDISTLGVPLSVGGAAFVNARSASPASSTLRPTISTLNSDAYNLGFDTSPFGTITMGKIPAHAGSVFGWSGSSLFVPDNYAGGVIGNGNLTVSGSTFSTFGLTPGLITIADWDGVGGDSLIQMNIVASAIPEPGSFVPLGALSLLGGFVLWRRRRKVTAAAHISCSSPPSG